MTLLGEHVLVGNVRNHSTFRIFEGLLVMVLYNFRIRNVQYPKVVKYIGI